MRHVKETQKRLAYKTTLRIVSDVAWNCFRGSVVCNMGFVAHGHVTSGMLHKLIFTIPETNFFQQQTLNTQVVKYFHCIMLILTFYLLLGFVVENLKEFTNFRHNKPMYEHYFFRTNKQTILVINSL